MVFLSLTGLGWWFLEPHTFLILGLLQWLLSQTSMNEIDKRVPANCLKWYHENTSELEWMSCTTNITKTWKSILCLVEIPMCLYILISIPTILSPVLYSPFVISLSRSQSSSLKHLIICFCCSHHLHLNVHPDKWLENRYPLCKPFRSKSLQLSQTIARTRLYTSYVRWWQVANAFTNRALFISYWRLIQIILDLKCGNCVGFFFHTGTIRLDKLFLM